MKKLLTLVSIAAALTITSCSKEEVKPVNVTTSTSTQTERTINVEYVIRANSGNMKINYVAAVDGKLVEHNVTMNRMVHSISFEYKSGNKYFVKASNVNPSQQEVTVELYINGILYASGVANTPTGVATAEAIVY